MIKLVIVAGLTISILGGLLALRARGGGTFRSNKDISIVNDIKEIFGLPPASIGSANSLTSAKTSLGGYSSSGGGGYLPPPSVRSEFDLQLGGTKNDSVADLTTPVFRIFIASTTSAISSSFTTHAAEAGTEESLSEAEEATTLPPTGPIDIGFHAELDVMNFSQQGRGEFEFIVIRNTSENTTVPVTLNPKVEIEIPVTTLQPPSPEPEGITLASVNLTKNVVNTEATSDPSMNGTRSDTKLRSGITSPPNGLYLPPNKEYLPPKQGI